MRMASIIVVLLSSLWSPNSVSTFFSIRIVKSSPGSWSAMFKNSFKDLFIGPNLRSL